MDLVSEKEEATSCRQLSVTLNQKILRTESPLIVQQLFTDLLWNH